MDYSDVARQLIEVLGGNANVHACNVCMTRLRITLGNSDKADLKMAAELDGVLGVVPRTANAIEVVFGPRKVEEVHRAILSELGGVEDSTTPAKVPFENLTVAISPARRHSYAKQAEALASLLGEEASSAKGSAAESAATADDKAGPRVLVINGPNINLLGLREPDVYGRRTFEDYLDELRRAYPDVTIDYFQSNCEGALIDKIHEAGFQCDGIVLNAGAYTHTSIALHDAIKAVTAPVVEVHISNVHSREPFRRQSMIAPACLGVVCGFGLDSYRLAVEALTKK